MKRATQILQLILFLASSFGTLRVHAAPPECANMDEKSIQQMTAETTFVVRCAQWQAISDQEAAEVLQKSARMCLHGATDGIEQAFGDIWQDIKAFASLIPGESAFSSSEKQLIHDLYAKNEDPVSGAAESSEASVADQQSALDHVRGIVKNTFPFWVGVASSISASNRIFWCLPASERVNAICQALTAVGLETAFTGASVKDAKMAVDIAKAAQDYMKEARAFRGVGNLSLTESIKQGTEAMRALDKGVLVQKVGDASLVEYTEPGTGAKYLKLESQIQGSDGKIQNVAREVQIDRKTGAIDANSEMGRLVVEKAAQLSATGEKQSLVFIDINHLGVTNYYKGKSGTGDAYITAVGSVIKSTIGPKDLFFKLGGDELAIIVKSTDPKEVRAVVEKISRGVAENPEAKAIFKTEVVEKSDRYKAVARATSVDQIPENVASQLSDEQRALAKTDFSKFKESLLKDQLTQLTSQARFRATVSTGSTEIGAQDTFGTAIVRAEKQESESKYQYKKKLGFSLEKYGGPATPTNKPDLNAVPEVQDPIPAPKWTRPTD
jgi:diguanylate cyclase (GGDEF)-like protein